MVQRGENPDRAKLAAFGSRPIQRGESPSKAELPAFGGPRECAHDDQPVAVIDTAKRRREKINRPMRFVSLHHHSTYSFLDGFQLPDAHARRVAELNGSALAMTEHGNMMSHAKFEQAVKKEKDANGNPNPAYGIKPIYGIEFYCGAISEGERKQTKNHLTVLAATQEGYRNLLRLNSRSWKEGFYYEPTVDGDMLRDHRDGLLVLSGCQGSLLASSLIGGKGIDPDEASYRRGKRVARQFKQAFGDRYFLEVQAFPELEDTCRINKMVARISRELKIPMVATLDCHYTVPLEAEIQKVLHALRSGGKHTPEDLAKSWGYKAALCPPTTDMSILRRLVATGLERQEAIDAILMTEEIAQDIDFELPKLEMVRFPLPRGYKSAHDLVWDLLRDGWKRRGLNHLSHSDQKLYKERMRYEMSIVEEKDYVDYFLIVADLVSWAKDQGIAVGPARGSAAASLVCWLLRITEVNPLMFPHLVFERFIDITREDLPDIDIDFEQARRNEVFEYAAAKYGGDRVVNIGTFTTFKAKLALDDVARVHRIPQFEVDKIKGVLLERSSGDLRASATIEDTIEQFEQAADVVNRHPEIMQATELEGNVKTFGIHAAGMAISTSGPITDVCSIIEKQVNDHARQVVMVDKYDAEHLGLLKLDILVVTVLDMLVDCCRMLGKPVSFLYDIPIDDDLVIQGFKENDIIGIFQYEGRAMRQVNASIKPDNFDEVCHITALARPGPLHNGAVAEYIKIKRGEKEPEVKHQALAEITGFTQFQVVYQEQILRIVREIGDFEWTHAAYIRKIISRKLGDAEFNRQWARFWEGCQRLHPDITEEQARSIWGLCTTAGSYAFNAAHSISYGYLAWWTMWWKRHHPDIFFAASLRRVDGKSGGGSGNAKASVTSSAKIDPASIMMRDAAKHGFEILPPDLKLSNVTWERVAGQSLVPSGSTPKSSVSLLAGFDQIPGIGEKVAWKITDWRDATAKSPLGLKGIGWSSMIDIPGIGHKTIERITEFVNAEDPFGIFALSKMLDQIRTELPKLGLPGTTHEAIDVPYEAGEDEEVVWLGIAVNRNLRDIFEANRSRTGEALNPDEVKDPHLNEWMLLAGYDGTDLLSLRVDRWKYPSLKRLLWKVKLNEDVILVQGVKKGYRTAREIVVKRMWVLEP